MNKKFNTITALALSAMMCGAFAACGEKEPLPGQTVQIYVDGGGANAHFNSTPSMEYDKYANPYPYNTLEKLAKEWNEQNTGYEIVIARSCTTASVTSLWSGRYGWWTKWRNM